MSLQAQFAEAENACELFWESRSDDSLIQYTMV
jgi:hypothetical protein